MASLSCCVLVTVLLERSMYDPPSTAAALAKRPLALMKS